MVIPDVEWRAYTKLILAFCGRRDVKLTYDRGVLEIMVPSLEHDDGSWFIGDLVFILAEELGLPLKRGGGVTIRRKLKKKGLEADACFWVANAAKLAGSRRLDLKVHPPPDLAIEVDVSRSSLNRMGIYAALGVPEVWRYDTAALTFHALAGKAYAETPTSLSFPGITAADLLPYIQQAATAGDESPITRAFRAWVRQRAAAPPSPPTP